MTTTCKPHVWEWPLPEGGTALSCRNCPRVLDVWDTTPNMRYSIANAIANGVYGGDEYHEVYASINDWFASALESARSVQRVSLPFPSRTREV